MLNMFVQVGGLNRCFYKVFGCHKAQRFGHDIGAGLPLNPKQVYGAWCVKIGRWRMLKAALICLLFVL